MECFGSKNEKNSAKLHTDFVGGVATEGEATYHRSHVVVWMYRGMARDRSGGERFSKRDST